MPLPITPDDLLLLKAVLGITDSINRKDWGSRNVLKVVRGTVQDASLCRLESFGFVEQINRYNKLIGYFVATEKGCRLAGLEEREIKRALEARGRWK